MLVAPPLVPTLLVQLAPNQSRFYCFAHQYFWSAQYHCSSSQLLLLISSAHQYFCFAHQYFCSAQYYCNSQLLLTCISALLTSILYCSRLLQLTTFATHIFCSPVFLLAIIAAHYFLLQCYTVSPVIQRCFTQIHAPRKAAHHYLAERELFYVSYEAGAEGLVMPLLLSPNASSP